MLHSPVHHTSVTPPRLLLVVLFFLANVAGARRLEAMENGSLPIIVALAFKVHKLAAALTTMMGNEYIAIIQMDPETFPPAVEPQSTFTSFTPYSPEQKWEKAPKSGPDGRVITDHSEG